MKAIIFILCLISTVSFAGSIRTNKICSAEYKIVENCLISEKVDLDGKYNLIIYDRKGKKHTLLLEGNYKEVVQSVFASLRINNNQDSFVTICFSETETKQVFFVETSNK